MTKEDKTLEDELEELGNADEITISHPTEMQGVAQEIFKEGRTFIPNEDKSTGLAVEKKIFTLIGMPELSIGDDLKENDKHIKGFSIGSLVKTTQGLNEARNGGGVIDKMKGWFGGGGEQ